MSRDDAVIDVAARLADRCDEDSVPYAFGGALALGAWGVPRPTKDVDISIFVAEQELDRAISIVERAGAHVDTEQAVREVERIGMFFALAGRTRVDVFISFHPFHEAMEQRRVQLRTPDGTERWFLSKEDIALLKIVFNRDKDRRDLERLFKVQGARMDTAHIESWLRKIAPPGDERLDHLANLVERFC